LSDPWVRFFSVIWRSKGSLEESLRLLMSRSLFIFFRGGRVFGPEIITLQAQISSIFCCCCFCGILKAALIDSIACAGRKKERDSDVEQYQEGANLNTNAFETEYHRAFLSYACSHLSLQTSIVVFLHKFHHFVFFHSMGWLQYLFSPTFRSLTKGTQEKTFILFLCVDCTAYLRQLLMCLASS
jgi:hypothetical protein